MQHELLSFCQTDQVEHILTRLSNLVKLYNSGTDNTSNVDNVCDYEKDYSSDDENDNGVVTKKCKA